ncbi:MAG: ATP synthase F1 subunit delta [Rickettsiales bacterium]
MSTNRTDALHIARRYATAIFDLALEAKKEETVVAEWLTLSAAITQNANLSDALENPVVTVAQKAATLQALIARGDQLTQRAVATVAEGGRAALIPVIAQDLRSRLAAHQGELEALVISARALSATTQKQLVQSLTKATGKTVQLKLKEDPSVLGGLCIELGSLRLDATLSGALNSMREHLLVPTH